MIPVAADPYPIVFAHRAGGDEAPGNSLAAIRHMRSLGVRHLETDAHVTRDGRVVLYHDHAFPVPVQALAPGQAKGAKKWRPSGEREADEDARAVPIDQMDWDQLRELRTPEGEPVPLLDDVLDAFPDIYLNIDAKVDEVVAPLVDVVESHGALGRVLFASFSEARLERIRALGRREITTSLGTGAVVRLLAASQTVSNPDTWRVPGPRQGARAAQVPEVFHGLPVVSRRFVATAHGAGLAVHVWTVNDAVQMTRLLDMHVDGIVTDRPTLAREILRSRGQWRGPEAG